MNRTLNNMFLFLVSLNIYSIYCIELNLISNYFKIQHINVITACVCNRKDASKLEKQMNFDKFRFKVHTAQSSDVLRFKSNYYPQGIFIDLTCDHNKQIIEREHVAMNTSFRWLAWIGSEDFSCLNRSTLRSDSDLIVASDDGKLYDVYKIALYHPVKIIPIGNWTKSGRISLGPKQFRYLTGIRLRISVLSYELEFNETNYFEILMNKTHRPTEDSLSRIHFSGEEALRYFYKYDIEPILANTTGFLLPNGKFTGYVGDVADNRSDLGAAPVQHFPHRADVIRYLQGFMRIRMIFLYLSPRELGTYKALIIPLSFEVWILIIVITVIMIICYYYVQKYSNLKRNDEYIGGGLLYAVGIVSQQGFYDESRKLSYRMMGIFMLALTMIISAYYNAAIMNGLLSPAPVKIKTLKQLMKSDFKLGRVNLPYMQVQDNLNSFFTKEDMERIRRDNNPSLQSKTGLLKVKTQKFAFAAEDAQLRHDSEGIFTDHEKCDLVEIDIIKYHAMLAIHKNSSYRELFTRGILLLQENGIRHRWIKYWHPEAAVCLGGTQFIHVSLEAVSVAILVFVLGVILSLFIIIFELIFARKMKINKRRILVQPIRSINN